jgi:cell division protein FtsA
MTLITGLDIGTTKVCCFAVQRGAEGTLQPAGYGVAPCRGLKQGQVVDMEQTVAAIQHAVHEAQTMGELTITGVVAGRHGRTYRGRFSDARRLPLHAPTARSRRKT